MLRGRLDTEAVQQMKTCYEFKHDQKKISWGYFGRDNHDVRDKRLARVTGIPLFQQLASFRCHLIMGHHG